MTLDDCAFWSFTLPLLKPESKRLDTMATSTTKHASQFDSRQPGLLEWFDNRWHLDGQGIHAGESLEVRWPDGTWERVRIESQDCGRRLYAHGMQYHGVDLCIRVDDDSYGYGMCWPA